MTIIGRGDRLNHPDFQRKGIFTFGEGEQNVVFSENGVLLTEREVKLLADFMHLNYRNVGAHGSFEEAEMWDLMGQTLRRVIDEASMNAGEKKTSAKEDMDVSIII